MKIETGVVLPASPTPSTAPPAGPAFSDLMAFGEPLEDDSRAAGFQARGMFGRHGATATAVEHPAPVLMAAASPPPATPGPERAVVPSAPSSRSAGPEFPQRPASSADDRLPPSIHATRPDAAMPDGANAGIGEVMADSGDAAQGEQPDIGAAPRRRTPAPASHQTLRVTVGKAGEPDAAALVVRAAGLDPREIAEFRARAQTLLRERGLALDKVRINGEDHPAVEAPGGGSQAWR